LKKAAELTHNMYQITYTLPDSKHTKTRLLNMDTEQAELYRIINKKFLGVATLKTGVLFFHNYRGKAQDSFRCPDKQLEIPGILPVRIAQVIGGSADLQMLFY